MLILLSVPETNTLKITQSDAEVFGGLYEQYLPKVFQYISYRVTDKNMAEDLTSAVFEKALTKFKSFNPERASFATWIFTIARNTIIDYYRGRSRELEYQKETQVQMTVQYDSPEEEAGRAEEVRKLHACLAKLNNNEKDIITLKFGSEMTNREIAKMLKLSESNVGTILCRAVRKLRDDFAGWKNE